MSAPQVLLPNPDELEKALQNALRRGGINPYHPKNLFGIYIQSPIIDKQTMGEVDFSFRHRKTEEGVALDYFIKGTNVLVLSITIPRETWQRKLTEYSKQGKP